MHPLQPSRRLTDQMPRLLEIAFELVMAIVVARGVLTAFRRLFGPSAGSAHSGGPTPFTPPGAQAKSETIRGETVRDPVCGMFVSTELSQRLNWHGEVLHFCSRECLESYRKKAV